MIVSDAIDLDVKSMSDLAVSLYVAKSEGEPTNHMVGLHTSYIASGDTAASVSMPKGDTTTGYLWLRSIDVVVPRFGFFPSRAWEIRSPTGSAPPAIPITRGLRSLQRDSVLCRQAHGSP